MKKIALAKWVGKAVSLVLTGLVLGLTACGDDDETGAAAPTEDIMTLINNNKGGTTGLDSLAKYLNTYPDLVSLLQSDGPYTVFAPTNAAFVTLLQTPGFPSSITLIDPDLIKGVLAYHVVAGENRSATVVAGATFNSSYTDPASGVVQTITVNADGTLLTGSTNSEINILEADLLATNGVVHTVESVMIPPTVGQTLTPILGTLAGTVLLGADFSYLADLIAIADSEVPDGEEAISAILASPPPAGEPDGTITAFVPVNAVFEGAAEVAGVSVEQFLGSFDAAAARTTLLTHVVTTGVVRSNELSNGATYTSAAGIDLAVTVEDTPTNSPTGVLVAAPGNDAPVPVVSADINTSNGVAHVIGGILLPQ